MHDSLIVKIPRGLKLRDFQVRALRFMLDNPHCYLGLDPGLGKTIIASVGVNERPGRVLYITPPFLKYNVLNELKKWVLGGPRIEIVKHGNDTKALHADIVILPDSLLTRTELRKRLLEQKFTWCYIDEAHRFKTFKTARTAALYGVRRYVKPWKSLTALATRKVAMSGTPMPNRVIELWPAITSLASDTIDFMTYWDFARKYTGANQANSWDVSKSINLGDLRARLSSNFLLRMKKSDVLTELPPKNEQIILLDNVKLSGEFKEIDRAMRFKLGVDTLSPLDDNLAKWRRMAGEAKVLTCAKTIREMIGTKPVVVFAHHIDVITKTAEYFADLNPLIIRGGVSIEERTKIVSEFQAGKVKMLIGNITAMGVGFTLTKAEDCFFIEYSWVPGENDQAADRLHRIGQLGQVNIYYFVITKTLDEIVLRTNLTKREHINKLMN